MFNVRPKKIAVFAALAAFLSSGATLAGIQTGTIVLADGPTAVYITEDLDDGFEGDAWDEDEGFTGDDAWGEDEGFTGDDAWDEEDSDDGDDAWDEEATEDEAAEDETSGDDDSWGQSIVNRRTSQQQRLISEADEARFKQLHTPVENELLKIEAEIGYDGNISLSRTMPLNVRLTNAGGDLSGSVCVNVYEYGRNYDRYEMPLFIPASGAKSVTLAIPLSVKQSTFTVEYRVSGEIIASVNVSPETVIDPINRLIGTLAADGTRLNYISISSNNDQLLRGEYFRTLSLNESTFPASRDLLDAFTMLVFDGFDARMLTGESQKALDEWLNGGGIVILGGGAGASATYPYFEKYTGILAGKLSQSPDITPAIMQALGVSEKALDQGVLLNDMETNDAIISGYDNKPLIAMKEAGDGLVITAAFELGAKPITDWAQ